MTLLSHTQGKTDIPLWDCTIGQALDQTSEKFGDRDALISLHQGIRWSYADFNQKVDELAAGFVALGLEKGDRVGIWSPNNAEWVLTQFATAKAGLILVTINPAYRVSELEYALNKVECKALVLAQTFKTSNYVEMLQRLAPEISNCVPARLKAAKLPHLKIAAVIADTAPDGFLTFSDISDRATDTARQNLKEVQASLSPDDAINVQFTSGTTGFPKGATLSHRNILNNGYFTGRRQNLTEADRMCIPVPLYHCFGMVLGTLCCVSFGAAMVFPGEAYDPETVLKAVEQEKCTSLYGVPTMFIAELSHPDFDQYDLSSLRTGVMAGSPCPIETMKKVIGKMHMSEVTIGYGMTETSPISMQSNPTDTLEKRVTTVGNVHPHVEVKIIDEDGNIVERGIQGEFCTRGYSVMKGYWGDEERTRESIDKDGWMHSGDLATMDEDGYVNITGRVKDMIIRGGENVYPKEIEEFLYRHEKIQDVQVFGVPDDKYGEEICAWIQLKPGQSANTQEIKDFCRDQIAHYKVPRYIKFVEEFPMTVTGKIQKFVMRDMMKEELHLHTQKTA
ncbi:AMP-binding protein [Kordiimonas sediminis]|uniref:3-methylmercaptopropionyl-CoA ligase n=1 Tax=Kordiimonas sediminis TaxID=1735581 RepID=A0A919E4A0_9PROT|nr:AMP-binding protein [Kordiimonas sediminis]GHF10936.1 AMP-binding protein [Kordiimonas sediminis]